LAPVTDFGVMTPDEMARALMVRVYEANVLSQGLAHTDVPVQIETVDRTGPLHGKGYTEIQVVAGEWSVPAREPRGDGIRP
jgi:hypothetical protein